MDRVVARATPIQTDAPAVRSDRAGDHGEGYELSPGREDHRGEDQQARSARAYARSRGATVNAGIDAQVAELEARGGGLERDITAAKRQLNDDLLNGRATGEGRSFLSGLAEELAAIRRDLAEIVTVGNRGGAGLPARALTTGFYWPLGGVLGAFAGGSAPRGPGSVGSTSGQRVQSGRPGRRAGGRSGTHPFLPGRTRTANAPGPVVGDDNPTAALRPYPDVGIGELLRDDRR